MRLFIDFLEMMKMKRKNNPSNNSPYRSEWIVISRRMHFIIFNNNTGFARVKCRHCEFEILAEKSHTLFALNHIVRHLVDTHKIPLEQVWLE
jgi:hypothetical protein